MVRLTERNSEGIGVLKQPYQCDRCGDLQWSLPDLGNGSPTDRLAEYEDLEEQGKLLKLPCAVGNMTYHANRIFGYIVDAIVERIEIDSDGSWVITSSGTHSFDDFGKTVFLTREEAEAALKELEEKHAESSEQ